MTLIWLIHSPAITNLLGGLPRPAGHPVACGALVALACGPLAVAWGPPLLPKSPLQTQDDV